MNGGDLPRPECVQAEAEGAGDCGKSQVGTEQLLQLKCSPWGFHHKDTICLLILHFQFMTQGNRTARSFLEHTGV